jgi:hypothetical protein
MWARCGSALVVFFVFFFCTLPASVGKFLSSQLFDQPAPRKKDLPTTCVPSRDQFELLGVLFGVLFMHNRPLLPFVGSVPLSSDLSIGLPLFLHWICWLEFCSIDIQASRSKELAISSLLRLCIDHE